MQFLMQNINKQNEGLICLLLMLYFLLITWNSRELIISNSASTEVSSHLNIYCIKVFWGRVFDEKSHNAFLCNFCIQTAHQGVVIADLNLFFSPLNQVNLWSCLWSVCISVLLVGNMQWYLQCCGNDVVGVSSVPGCFWNASSLSACGRGRRGFWLSTCHGHSW